MATTETPVTNSKFTSMVAMSHQWIDRLSVADGDDEVEAATRKALRKSTPEATIQEWIAAGKIAHKENIDMYKYVMRGI